MIRLSFPVVIVQVGIVSLGTVDTMIVGHVSGQALASVALGTLYLFVLLVFGMGVLMSLDPIVSQAVGARDTEAVARGVQRGAIIAIAMSGIVSLGLLAAHAVFIAAQQPPEIIPAATAYARASIAGILPFYIFVVLRQSLQAMHHLRPVVITVIVANLINAVLNWVFVFGHLGMQPHGIIGSAWASNVSRWVMALLLLVLSWRHLAPILTPWRPHTLTWRPVTRMLRIGIPIGLQMEIEVGAFATVALLMGHLGTIQMAAHQVAINIAALTFMVPTGIAGAASILVGQAIGRGEPGTARQAAKAALICGVGFMGVSAIVFLTIPRLVAGLYTADLAVLTFAAVFIPIAGIFQVFDGTQTVCSGILRGIGDTRVPMFANILCFWGVGIPLSVYLAFHTTAGPAGLWWGLVAGLGAVATFLTLRVRHRMRRSLTRVLIDDHMPFPTA
jgi:MATE family multidrug resistance protein